MVPQANRSQEVGMYLLDWRAKAQGELPEVHEIFRRPKANTQKVMKI